MTYSHSLRSGLPRLVSVSCVVICKRFIQAFHVLLSTRIKQKEAAGFESLCDTVGCSDSVGCSDTVIQCDTVKSHRQNRAGILPELAFYRWVMPGMMRDFQKFCRPPPLFPPSRPRPGSIPAESRRHFGSICHTEKEQFPMQPVSICLISR